jgi:GntR family transcriptional regulator/MocR family aminotransferase
MLRHPPANNQRAVALFLSLGHHDALVRRLSARLRRAAPAAGPGGGGVLPDWRVAPATGGTSIWLEGPRGTDARSLAEAAAARSVLIEPGDRCLRGRAPSRFVRLGISSIALQHIEPGIRELATAAGRRPAAA